MVVCKHCYGRNLATGFWSLKLGKQLVPSLPNQSGEPGTQLTMRTFHTGGVAGDDITQGLPRVQKSLKPVIRRTSGHYRSYRRSHRYLRRSFNSDQRSDHQRGNRYAYVYRSLYFPDESSRRRLYPSWCTIDRRIDRSKTTVTSSRCLVCLKTIYYGSSTRLPDARV